MAAPWPLARAYPHVSLPRKFACVSPCVGGKARRALRGTFEYICEVLAVETVDGAALQFSPELVVIEMGACAT